ncbi:substrate-binding domain-containing protein [Imbroritus primus]|uniref:substrate-binding domain-containing protein n=1 Tax=Imbroritus primus TaxID=3058603 RepID=UPI003D160DC0
MTFRFELFPVISQDDNPRANGKLFKLLRAVRETGSLHQAAPGVGLSYRHAWGIMRTWEETLGRSLLDMERGRGASLTTFGERLLRAETRLHDELTPAIQQALLHFLNELEDAAKPEKVIRFSGSHDPAVELLANVLGKTTGAPDLDTVFCGSVEGLISLQEKQCELAGVYVSPVQAAGSVAHLTLRKWMKPNAIRLIRVADREQGLIVSPRYVTQIHTLADLARTRATFVNRQRSSGTRMLFDQLLASHGLFPDEIAGYDNQEFSNERVAQAVAEGRADVGFGLRVNAEALGLGFVPMTREDYFLAIRRHDHLAAWVRQLLEVISSPDFAAQIARLPGYSANPAASVLTPEEALPWFDGNTR